MTLQDYINAVQALVHDQSATDWTVAEQTTYVNSARNRVALDLHCVRRLYQGGTLIPNQEQYPITGGTVGATVTAPGTLYTSAPTVTFAAPGGTGTTATGIAVVSSGVVTQIQMTNWGSGYTAIPAVTITGGGGSGAAATALTVINAFDINSIAATNGNLRYTMDWLPFTAFQAFVRAYFTQRQAPAIWTTFDEMQLLFIGPIPDQSYPVDLDMVTMPINLVNLTDIDLQVLQPNADAVQFYAAHLALLKLQNFEHAEYMHKKYKARVNEIQMTKRTRRVTSVYQNWFRRLRRM